METEKKVTETTEVPAAETAEATETKEPKFEINPDISFSVSEAYKALRTNINFSIPGSGKKSFLVTSAISGEGKTTIASSIALTTAQMDTSVVVVDCDMRRPKIHSMYKLTNKVGLSNLLGGMCTLEEAIQHVEGVSLDVISSGVIPPNPSELLASPQMESLVAELKERYDYVVLDTPPVDIVADALTLTKLVDGVVIVVRHQLSMHPEVATAVERLEFSGAHILGFVVTGIEETTSYYRARYKRRGRYGYSRKKGYGYSSYGYGYGYGSSKKKDKEAKPSGKEGK